MHDTSRDACAALLEQTLERAADSVGDITASAMQRFYGAYPEARDAFERLALGTGPIWKRAWWKTACIT